MITIAICDDDKNFTKELKNALGKCAENTIANMKCSVFYQGKDAIEEFKTNSCDAIFLDIDMPEINGFQIAKTLKMINPNCIIIFCSNHNELVFDSFEYEPLWFLCKDNFETKLEVIFEKLIAKIQLQNEEFVIKKKDDIFRVKYKDISYVTIFHHNVQIHKKEKTIEFRGNLSDFEENFFKKNFIKVNSGCLVNLEEIYRIQDNQIILNNREIITISRSRKKEVKESFFSYLERK